MQDQRNSAITTVPSVAPGTLVDHLSPQMAWTQLGVSAARLRSWQRSGKLVGQNGSSGEGLVYRREDLETLTRNHGGRSLAAGADWDRLKSAEHLVQFYESDEHLAATVADFVAAALGRAGAAVVIATPVHRSAIEQELQAAPETVQAALRGGACSFLDAAATLAQFMSDGELDHDAFRRVMGNALRAARARCPGGPVHAFGEMVALLWAQGDRPQALALEGAWNELLRHQDFSLLCGYPLAAFPSEADRASFHSVCGCHSVVLPAESFADAEDAGERDRIVGDLQQRAFALGNEVARRREAEEALGERERELTDFLENAAEGLHQVGPDGRILWANRAELELLGYSADEYIGRDVRDLHVDRPAIEDLLQRLVRGETVRDWPARLRCRDGSIRSVRISSNGLFRHGRFCYSRCFTRDVTAQEAVVAEQQRLLAEAARVGRMKDEFLATLSHELRTPLNAIYGWTQLIKEAPADQAVVEEGVTVIERNIRAQTALIQDLLDMSRIVSGNLRLDRQEVDLTAVLQDAMESVRPAAAEKHIPLRLTVDGAARLAVHGDAGRLQQVFWNLLTNAVKFSPVGGAVEIHVERSDALLEISVRDTGVGIAPEFLPCVFERFRQADSSIVRRHGGLGLGLAIVKQLTELHGGSITARSGGLGQGATFTVRLPLATPAPSGPAATVPRAEFGRPPAEMVSLHGARILVVEDEPDSREFIGRILRARGAEVQLAESAAAAMVAFPLWQPQAIVSDIAMPDRDGHEMIRDLRERFPREMQHLPTIALTAFARSEDRTKALRSGYQLHMAKPVEPDELVVSLASLLRMRQG